MKEKTASFHSVVTKGIDFLFCSQLSYGEFETTISRESLMKNAKVSLASSPYITTFVLHSISFSSENTKVISMTRKSLDFLLDMMEEYSTWRFYPKKNKKAVYMNGGFKYLDMRIVPDFDDTACVSHALKINRISFPSNEELFNDAKADNNAFPTWIIDKEILIKEQDFVPLNNYNCCGVNANILMYLGDRQDVSNYINRIVRNNEEASCNHYFPNRLVLYYLISRAYFFGATSLKRSGENVKAKILDYLTIEQGNDDILSVILAIASLLNFNYFTQDLSKWINVIVDAQNPDGSWPAISFFIDEPNGNHYGSRELTTALAIEVLAKVSSYS